MTRGIEFYKQVNGILGLSTRGYKNQAAGKAPLTSDGADRFRFVPGPGWNRVKERPPWTDLGARFGDERACPLFSILGGPVKLGQATETIYYSGR